jgi:tetratricopeptide (TPR) repeat protein
VTPKNKSIQSSANRVRGRCCEFVILSLLLAPIEARSTEDDLVGRRFMPRAGATYLAGDREIDPESISLPFTATATEGDWIVLGQARVKKTEVVSLENAEVYYAYYLLLNPQSSWAYHHRGIVRHTSQELDKAIKDYTEAIRLEPNSGSSYNTRGAAFKDKGELVAALKDFDEAIRLDPASGTAFRNRGITHHTNKNFGQAIEDYTAAIRLDPTDHDSYNGRAWIQATSRDDRLRRPENAVADAKKACELANWENSASLDTLAAAYAAVGEFKHATEYQQKAIDLASQDEVADYKDRLQLYRDGKPFRD